MSVLLLNLFIIVPVLAYRIARNRAPHHVYCITGASVGAVIGPVSFGLYSWYFVSPIGVVPGIAGLMLLIMHEGPGFYLAVNCGLVPAGKVVTGFAQHAIVEVLNGAIWLVCYGIIGYMIDRFRFRRK